MASSRVLAVGLAVGIAVTNAALAQFPGIPHGPSKSRRQRQRGDEGAQAHPSGVPVPADSPLFEAFRRLESQSVYHQRMTLTVNDPQMEQIMTQMGFGPAETIAAGDTKQVSLHFKMPVLGNVEDFELRSVSRNGRVAKKWSSPASGRILKAQDASIAKQLAQYEEQSAMSIARSLAAGPTGWVSAGMAGAAAAANVAAAARLRKQAHEFFEWSCMDGGAATAQARREPPPLTDLRVVGDQTLEGVSVTGYEFFVNEGGRFHGPVQLFVAKDSGLPMRIGMSEARAGGSMRMDYFGFNQGGDFEVPACLAEK